MAFSQEARETIAEIRVHGNYTTGDADILALSGLTIGDEATAARIGDAEAKLRNSGRFESVEVRRRYRSIANPSEILIMIVVDEHPSGSAGDLTPGWGKRLLGRGMLFPILAYEDGYGFTYGARLSFVNALGGRSRISVPATWGGERKIAAELERSSLGPISVVRGALALNRRENPHYELPDTRREARIAAARSITPWLRAGAAARISQVEFGPDYDAQHTAQGLHVVADTRTDPSFPRNAAHARLDWERLSFGSGTAHRWLADLRGYVGIGGPAVLAARGQLARTDEALPPAEQPLLGGSDSLRGYHAGHRAGDSLAAVSAEARLPLNSPLSFGRLGVRAFVDAGTTWNAGERLSDQRFDRGIGGGLYFGAGPLMTNVDIAWPEEGKARVHFGLGVAF